jgi:hypothetical protein
MDEAQRTGRSREIFPTAPMTPSSVPSSWLTTEIDRVSQTPTRMSLVGLKTELKRMLQS